jgi:hypothetical protein
MLPETGKDTGLKITLYYLRNKLDMFGDSVEGSCMFGLAGSCNAGPLRLYLSTEA